MKHFEYLPVIGTNKKQCTYGLADDSKVRVTDISEQNHNIIQGLDFLPSWSNRLGMKCNCAK